MNIALIIVQIILAALYLMGGLYKITGQAPMLEQTMPGFSLSLIRIVGVVEALAALGLLLPIILRKWNKLAGWAAVVIAIEALAFVLYHLSHKANGPALATLILGFLASFVAMKRLK